MSRRLVDDDLALSLIVSGILAALVIRMLHWLLGEP